MATARVKGLSVTALLLIAIGIGYLWELVAAGGPGNLFEGPSAVDLIKAGALVPVKLDGTGGLVGGEWWRLVTAMFLHAGLIHLALNSYVLWIFGSMMESEIGRLPMLGVFFATGIFAGAASYAFAPGFIVAVGASGAIFGLVGAFIAYNYRRRHLMLAQARLRAAASMLILNLIIGFTIPAIDWRAHLGGVVAGVVAGLAVDPGRQPGARRLISIVGLLLIVAAAVVLVIVRTNQIQANPSVLGG